jgi:hypothetical protein
MKMKNQEKHNKKQYQEIAAIYLDAFN